MIWVGISYQYRTILVFIDRNLNAQRYYDKNLRPHVHPDCIAAGFNKIMLVHMSLACAGII